MVKTEENSINSNLKLCGCGKCNELIFEKDVWGRTRKFVKGHNMKDSNHHNYKNGIRINVQKYILIYKPEHPFRNKHNLIMLHRLIMEKHLGRYLTKDEDVHHINGIVTENLFSNLKLLPRIEHRRLHKIDNKYGTKNMNDRICLLCKSNKTYIRKNNGRPIWYSYQDGFVCNKCYSNGVIS